MDIITNTVNLILIGIIRFYQLVISPYVVGSCRHMPTCSQYTIDAIRHYGPIKGIYVSIKRILRCRPSGSYGYDPVIHKDEK